MVCGRLRTWGLIALAVLLVLIVGGIVGFRMGIGILKGKVGEALDPDSEITAIRMGWSSVEVEGLSSVKTQLRSVDLVVLQPYLIKADETGVLKGILDLDLESDVSKNRLKASGKVTISDLELAPAKGAFGTFMGVPRGAVVAFLKNKGNEGPGASPATWSPEPLPCCHWESVR